MGGEGGLIRRLESCAITERECLTLSCIFVTWLQLLHYTVWRYSQYPMILPSTVLVLDPTVHIGFQQQC